MTANKALRSVADSDTPDVLNWISERARVLNMPRVDIALPGIDMAPATAVRHKLGSFSKLITGLLLMRAADMGLCRLSDTADKHLPGAGPFGRVMPAPTLWDLLSHRGGIPRGSGAPGAKVRQDALHAACGDRVEPGHVDARYSNLGFVLLGQVLEHLHGMTWGDLARTTLFAPLALDTLGVGVPEVPPPLAPPHQLRGFHPDACLPLEIAPMPLLSAPAASQDLHGTVADWALLLTCLSQQDGAQGWADRFSRLFNLVAREGGTRGGLRIGAGLQVGQSTMGPIAFEAAEHFGHGAAFALLPGRGLSVTLATNRAGAGADLMHMAMVLLRHLAQGEPLQIPHAGWPECGTYMANTGDTLRIEGTSAVVNDDAPVTLQTLGGGRLIAESGVLAPFGLMLDRGAGTIHAGNRSFRLRAFPKAQGAKRCRLPAGFYANPDLGRIALYQRDGGTVLAFAPFKEARLEPDGEGCLRQVDGPAAGERLHYAIGPARLWIGGHPFTIAEEGFWQ
ncbi:serine hydrolase [uncultured Tateyamaria sp.]|uniref:serine hydrolase domain-containing protein n=1 Tax=uncultured Tateyamaria sp. TaxID=455651 RepID=UPI00261EFE58|nr:serine hydrolase domain-containing protein [uncultured Tateyamaria sp.]